MPVLALPAVVAGLAAPHDFITTAYVGVAGFLAVAVCSGAAFGWDRALLIVGRAARWLQRVKRDSAVDLPDRLIEQRDRMKQTFGRRWHVAVAVCVYPLG